MVGVAVGRRSRVRGDEVVPFGRTDRQRVPDHDPAVGGLPRRLDDVRAGDVDARRRHVDPERPYPERPGSAVEEGAEHARGIEGRDAQPIDRAVRGDERAGVAVGQERVVGDRWERRRRRGAPRRRRRAVLRAAHRGHPRVVPLPVSGDQGVRGLRSPRTLLVRVDGRRRVQQRLHDPPGLLDPVLSREAGGVAHHRRVEQHLVRRRALAALLGELHVEGDLLGSSAVRAPRIELEPDPGGGVELHDDLIRLRPPVLLEGEPQPRRVLADQPKLGLRGRQMLPRADEERHARPPPVVDVQAERGERLRRRIGSHAVVSR